MRNTIKITGAVAAAAALALGLGACSAPSDPDTGKKDDANAPLTVGATSVPQGQILDYVKKNLASKEGLKLNVRTFEDYTLVDPATENGELDANYFQHKEYLDEFNTKQNGHIVPVVNVHLEPMGLYSKKHTKLSELGSGSLIGVPNDPSNQGRALKLLASKGLIVLKDKNADNPGLNDIKDAKGLKFEEAKAETLPSSLPDYDAAAINGNYAIPAKLKPSKDALAIEPVQGNPYANFLAVKKGNEDDPRVKKLAKLLNSDAVKKYIEKTYSDGSALPSFGKPKN
ncbi:MetQ/NlpA family ABC transporter substrate-binding protein [Streptomyces pinistramenti]|uniref:MetQ/NlpA family ABC transporter substrate-binding protein n=1 Tax=Streptomyces pinistramenti TaxID=2884812 RepID=UPI001D084CB3|nr:MetQ/NlpA family ABC transporter substrate-binding protein [Streptomyces pinistramenti]MCB5911086.1 MetQ/NlpA family ABC transporter substrate-binding protein [Streptomyces pinistramenti]